MVRFNLLESGVDFIRPQDLSTLKVGDKVLTKKSIATGWARVGVVTRIMKTQIEVEITNVIPTIDHNRFGTKNPFVNDRLKGDFFTHWSDLKKAVVGKRTKFFKDGGVEVGMSSLWNSNGIAVLTA